MTSAPFNSATDSATSITSTRPTLAKPVGVSPRPCACSAPMRFARVTSSAGSSPLTTLITNDSATTNAIVRSVGSNVIQNGMSVIMPTRNLSATWAKRKSHHRRDRTENRDLRKQLADDARAAGANAVRTASSDDRDHVRANTSEAMFEATTSSASTRTATRPDITVLMMSSSPVNGSARTEIAVPGRRGCSGREYALSSAVAPSNRESVAEDAKHRERGRSSGECRFIKRHPDFTAGKLERIWKHADDGACQARESNRLAEDRGARAESPAPHAFAQHDDGLGARLAVRGGEDAAEHRHRREKLERSRCDQADADRLDGAVRVFKRELGPALGAEMNERLRRVANRVIPVEIDLDVVLGFGVHAPAGRTDRRWRMAASCRERLRAG